MKKTTSLFPLFLCIFSCLLLISQEVFAQRYYAFSYDKEYGVMDAKDRSTWGCPYKKIELTYLVSNT